MTLSSTRRRNASAFKRAFGLDGPDKTWEDIIEFELTHGPLPVPGDYRSPNARFAIYSNYFDQQYILQMKRLDLPYAVGREFLDALSFFFFFQTESDVLRAVQRDIDSVYWGKPSDDPFVKPFYGVWPTPNWPLHVYWGEPGAHPMASALLEVTTNANSPLRTDAVRLNQTFNLTGHPMPWSALMAAKGGKPAK